MALTDNILVFYSLADVTDDVGALDLTNNGSVSFATGKVGNGADFGTAQNKYLSTTSDLGYGTGNISFSCWVKCTSAPASGAEQRIFLYTDDSSSYSVYALYYQNNGGVLQLYYERTKQNVANTTDLYTVTLTVDTWFHIALVWDGSTLTLYVNGSSVDSLSSSGNGTADTGYGTGLAIGTSVFGGTPSASRWKGMIDEFGVWARDLSGSEISQLYNSGNGNAYPFSVAYTLALAQGSYALTGQTITFPVALSIALAYGTYTLTGVATTFTIALKLALEYGSYVLTGIAALFTFHEKYTEEPLQTNSFSKSALPTNSYTKEPLANT